MNISALLFAMAVGLVFVSLAMLLLFLSRRRPEQHVSSRFAPVSDVPDYQPGESNSLVALLSNTGRGMERWFQDDDVTTAQLLTRAGWRDARARSLFYIAQIALPIFGVLAVLLIGSASQKAGMGGMLVYGIGAVALGILAPRYFLKSAARSRQEKVRGEVPVFIHMLVMLSDSGLSTRQSLNSLVREGAQVLPEL
ncbi:MAG: hypothetical protein ACPHER_10960, partial [Nevskiales bacterium]